MDRLRLRKDEGFSLVELLVTVVIIAVLAAIAIPLYTSQKNKAALATAQDDARAAVMEMLSNTADYTTFGTTDGTIAGSGTPVTAITITMGTTPSPAGATKATTVRLSPGSTITAGSTGANSTNFCIVVTNGGQAAAANNAGVKSTGTCASGV